MPTEPPPGRYKVVERGRRLQVIDTRANGRPRDVATKVLRPQKSTPAGIGRLIALILAQGATDEHGDPIVDTRPSYDLQAPRLVVLNGAAQQKIAMAAFAIFVLATIAIVGTILFPMAPILVIALALAPVQSWLRARSTRWIDDIQADAARSNAG